MTGPFDHLIAGVLTTWAIVGRPSGGDYEYTLWQIGKPVPA